MECSNFLQASAGKVLQKSVMRWRHSALVDGSSPDFDTDCWRRGQTDSIGDKSADKAGQNALAQKPWRGVLANKP